MRAPRALDRDAVDLAAGRSSPSACCSTSIGQRGRSSSPPLPRCLLDLRDRVERAVERGGETARAPRCDSSPSKPAGDEDRRPAVALGAATRARSPGSARGTVGFAIFQPFRCRIGRTAPSRRGLRNLFSASSPRAVRSPPRRRRRRRRRRRSRIVEGCPEGVHERSSRARRPRGSSPGVSGAAWLGIPPGNENWRKSSRSPSSPRTDVRVQLAVRPLEVGVRDVCRAAVTRPGDEDRVEVARPDRAVQVRVDEVQARHGPEVAEQPRLHVLGLQRLAQQRVVEQVDLPDREIVLQRASRRREARAPPGSACRRPRPWTASLHRPQCDIVPGGLPTLSRPTWPRSTRAKAWLTNG